MAATSTLGTPPTPAPPAPAYPPPEFRCTQEVRFAVVMYGGVSLAIYINGIAQELFRLVRATAPVPTDTGPGATALLAEHQLTEGELVYRRLGQMLERGRAVPHPLPTTPEERARCPLRTRFVVDVLSGTSAGGINAIYLAKALANDQPFAPLRDLWVEGGDIGRLINDGESVKGLPLPPPEPPRSLLNSQRMYRQLLEAFQRMGHLGGPGNTGSPGSPGSASQVAQPVPGAAGERPSPLADELDLFVTATDVRGLPVPLQLDEVVYERRHRHVFHFRYASTHATGVARNDFRTANDPFLAFAARCTSAFPFAFEPMRLRDVRDVAKTLDAPGTSAAYPDDDPCWRTFFAGYPENEELSARPFTDGGYLDNRPFSYAIETLAQRHAGVPVDRKLLFIDPSPEHPEAAWAPAEGPNVVENVLAALTLARYETIREDLQRVLDGNRLLAKVNRVTFGVDEDLAIAYSSLPPPLSTTVWAAMDLAEMLRVWGVGYGAYHRLKVADVTDEVAAYITAAAGLDEQSDACQAVRHLVRVWRDRQYVDYYPALPAPDTVDRLPPTQNQLLVQYDFAYRLRRLHFVRRKIDDLSRLDDPRTAEMIQRMGVEYPADDAAQEDFRHALWEAKAQLDAARRDLVLARACLRRRGAANPLHAAVVKTGVTLDVLAGLLAEPDDAARLAHAGELLDSADRAARFQVLAEELAGHVTQASTQARDACVALLDPAAYPADLPPAGRAARQVLWHFYQSYEHYDVAIFPALYATGMGEADPVEVVRIGPEPPRRPGDPPRPRRPKLAGTALFNFGAFLEAVWRRSDIMWGRLDGAERIITAMLPPGAEREALLAAARQAIIREELVPADRETLLALLVDVLRETLGRPADPDELEQVIRELVARQLAPAVDSRMVEALRSLLDPQALSRYLRESFRIHPPQPDPGAMVRTLARATQVVGRMLEGLAADADTRRQAAWVTRLGQVFWGLAEVAVPHSVPHLLFRHWRNLITLFALLLVLLSVPLNSPAMATSGATILAVVLGLSVAVWALGDFMSGRPGAWRVLRGLAVLLLPVVLGLTLVGARHLAQDARVLLAAVGPEQVLVQAAGLLALAVAFPGTAAAALALRRPAAALPLRFHSPVLALEFVRSPAEARQVAGGRPGDARRDRLAVATYADFGFIAAYLLLFLALAAVVFWSQALGSLAGPGGPVWELVPGVPIDLAAVRWGQVLAALIGLSAVLTAGFDVAENRRILRLLDLAVVDMTRPDGGERAIWQALRQLSLPIVDVSEPPPVTPAAQRQHDAVLALAGAIRRAAFAKWLFAFGVVALLAIALLGAGGALGALGLLYLFTALTGALSVVLVKWPGDGRPLQLTFLVLLIGLLLLGALLAFWPDAAVARLQLR